MSDINFDDLIDFVVVAAQTLEASHEWGVGSAAAERHLAKERGNLMDEIERIAALEQEVGRQRAVIVDLESRIREYQE